MVPTAAPTNVGQPYGNVVIAPLAPVVLPLLGLPDLLTPSASHGSAATPRDTPVDAALGGSDLVSCELVFSVVTPPAHGTLGAIANQACALGLPSSDRAEVTYTPGAGYTGDDSFTYKVSDGTRDSAPATIALTVTPLPPPTCATGPVAGCRLPTKSGKSPLSVSNPAGTGNDRLTWKWTYGAATSLGDFGTPLVDTNYQLCAFDAQGRTIARASAPPGGDCGGRPCWKQTATKIAYRSRDRRPAGGGPRSSVRMTLRPGAAGKARIVVQGRGVHLDLSPLPAAQPVRVQLKSSAGQCWEAVYSVPPKRNDATRFQDRGD
jgi:hypothetical protein